MIARSFKMAFSNIKINLTRTIITIIGISISVFSLCLISVVGNFSRELLNKEFKSLGSDSIIVGITDEGAKIPLTDKESNVIKANSNVKSVASVLTKFSQVKMHGYVSKCLVWGIDENAKNIVSLKTMYGRGFLREDIASSDKVCLVDKNIAKLFYNRENIVGKNIDILLNGKYNRFKIIGVVRTGGGLTSGIMSNYVPGFIYVPNTCLKNLLGTNQYDKLAVEIKDKALKNETADNIEQSLLSLIGKQKGYRAEDMEKVNEQGKMISAYVEASLSAIAGISLLVATMSIMTIMISESKYRVKEIGIKKSIGANNLDIIAEFTAEIFTLGLIGSIIGISFAELALLFIRLFLGFNNNLDLLLLNPKSISLGVFAPVLYSLLSISLSLAFGIYPAYKASKIDITQALK